MKIFVSYSSNQVKLTEKIREILEDFQYTVFIANDDIRIAQDWKKRIFDELKTSSIIVLLISKDFKNSDWCSQEIGIAYSLDSKILPISIDGTRTYGFINHLQAKTITSQFSIEMLIYEGLLQLDFPYNINYFIGKLEKVNTFSSAENLFGLLMPYINEINNDNLDKICQMSIDNGQIWKADLCRKKYLPTIIKERFNDIDKSKIEILNYQLVNQKCY